MKTKILITIACIFTLCSTTVAQREGGVIISDDPDKTEPESSAILHLESSEKGLLIPRITHAKKDQLDPTDGLVVYAIDDPKGFWYYDEHEEKWLQLVEDNEIPNWAAPPAGGIVMYHGSADMFTDCGAGVKGEDMEGWHLCNGCEMHGATIPDLQGRFVVSGNVGTPESPYPDDPPPEEYSTMSDGQNQAPETPAGQDEYILTKSQLPDHQHDMTNDDDNTTSYTATHYHKLHQDAHQHEVKTESARAEGTMKAKRGGNNDDQHIKKYSSGESPISIINTQSAVAKISFTVDEDVIEESGNQPEVNIDNRPPYYVIAYIIKVDKDLTKDNPQIEY